MKNEDLNEIDDIFNSKKTSRNSGINKDKNSSNSKDKTDNKDSKDLKSTSKSSSKKTSSRPSSNDKNDLNSNKDNSKNNKNKTLKRLNDDDGFSDSRGTKNSLVVFYLYMSHIFIFMYIKY